jgi:hypothetical protein
MTSSLVWTKCRTAARSAALWSRGTAALRRRAACAAGGYREPRISPVGVVRWSGAAHSPVIRGEMKCRWRSSPGRARRACSASVPSPHDDTSCRAHIAAAAGSLPSRPRRIPGARDLRFVLALGRQRAQPLRPGRRLARPEIADALAVGHQRVATHRARLVPTTGALTGRTTVSRSPASRITSRRTTTTPPPVRVPPVAVTDAVRCLGRRRVDRASRWARAYPACRRAPAGVLGQGPGATGGGATPALTLGPEHYADGCEHPQHVAACRGAAR